MRIYTYELVYTSTNNSCSMVLLSVTYSIDGDADRIEIPLNNSLLATYEVHNDGHNWNAFLTEVGFHVGLAMCKCESAILFVTIRV